MSSPKSKIIGGGSVQGGIIKGSSQYKRPAKEITPEVLDQVKESYEKFIEKEFYSQELLDNYIFMHDSQTIIELFVCNPFPKKESTIVDTDLTPFKTARNVIFAIGKVLAVSPDVNKRMSADGTTMVDVPEQRKLKVGDIVTLRDYDVATMINPKYEVIHSAKAMNKSNATVTSKAPDKYMNNIGNKVRNIFLPNKLDLRTQYLDNYVFEVGTPEIRFKLKDPRVLINSMFDYAVQED